MLRQTLITIFVAILLTGCASTNVSSYRDPNFATTSYSHPLLQVDIDGLAHQKAIEQAFYEKLSEVGLPVVRGMDVFPPTRQLSAEDRAKIFIDSQADCMIIVALKEGTIKEQKYEIRIIDKKIGKIAWVGDSSTKSVYDVKFRTDDMTLHTMFKSLASSIVDRLLLERILVVAQ